MNISVHQLTRYALVGGTAYLLEMAVLVMLHDVLNISALASIAISFWFGFIVAFLMQKFITFQNHNRRVRILTRQLGAYSALVAFNYFFTLGAVALLEGHLPVIATRTIVIAVTMLWNFLLYRRLFAHGNDDAPA